ncbi:hypothetical protein U8C32_07130 [Sinorhizobium medicae]|uniref:hypothetical protein n=1 Tax=Sinorhizobium medicae TaxID=110321 RepID=UPI002AF6A83E|nr:hypothetical protein [Sinorhizobium medicae]WQO93348.1 hypothetical protein U8C32_07130 [Sinorhizobium medicae]
MLLAVDDNRVAAAIPDRRRDEIGLGFVDECSFEDDIVVHEMDKSSEGVIDPCA